MSTATVNGTQIWYDTHGQGEPLILLPGLGLDHGYYRFAVPLLAPHFEVISVDPRGIGGSAKDDPSSVNYSTELWADDFAALLRHLGHERAHILGSSLGGAMAMSLALRYPDLVASLTVVGGFADMDRAMALNFDLRKRLIAALGMGSEVADFMGLSTMTREFMDTEEGFEVMRANQEIIRNNSPVLYAAFLDATLRWGRKLPGQENEPPMLDQVQKIAKPTLVVAGDNDYFIPAAFSKRIAERIEGSNYVEIPSGGHIPFIEKPRKTAEVVLNFMQDL